MTRRAGHGGRALLLAACLSAFGPAQANAPSLRDLYARPPQQWPAAWIDPGVDFAELGSPAHSRQDRSEAARAELGERLFFDARLSVDGSVSCASCHRPDHGWSVPAPLSTGMAGSKGRRNPPGLHTVAARRHLDWDGRDIALAARSLEPLTAPGEMGNLDLAGVEARLATIDEYGQAARALYSTERLTAALAGDALAAFQSGLDRQTRFDRFVAGDAGQLDDREIRGLHLFRTKARCANCHFGPLLTDERFHNLKISFFGEKTEDLGRYLVTDRAEDAGAMRTPSLRHVAQTAPYMHNGLFPSLRNVINLYDRGGGEVRARNDAEADHPLFPHAARVSPLIKPLHLTEDEKSALEAFLKTL
ncbi:cytochrome-c peroxidase [Rhizobiaceae bacterium BDR2-2]|uniref:Cytochrome-c peroxidase n=1 Tax=Ectorhizobium quercum TaxID=2965071 RepID=A0AAE3N5Y0_9HYPH|nr:cytochrome c peroxidase [Ectorhizobium quercum]MCX8999870.1 cytochrome-c peroxidase [Ectorhizobium quercum]